MNSAERFLTDEKYRLHRLKHFGEKYGWQLKSDDGEIISFISYHYAILKINYKNLNVETRLSHPEWGPTHLVRTGDFTQKLIEAIFKNPRAHMPREIKSEYIPV